MEARRPSTPSRRRGLSRPPPPPLPLPPSRFRLLLRVHSAESLRHASSAGLYCKLYVGDHEMTHGTRSSLKRFLGDTRSDAAAAAASTDVLPMRVLKTNVRKDTRGCPAWKEMFEIPVADPMREVLSIRVKHARLMTTSVVGACVVTLRDLTDESEDRRVLLVDSHRRPVGRLRLQLRLVDDSAVKPEDDGDDAALDGDIQAERDGPVSRESRMVDCRLTMPTELRRSTRQYMHSRRRSTRSSSAASSFIGRESGESVSTAASDSIVSDHSMRAGSVPMVTEYPLSKEAYGAPNHEPFNRPASTPSLRLTMRDLLSSDDQKQSDTVMSRGPMKPEELELDKPEVEVIRRHVDAIKNEDRSPRTTDNTADSSDEDDDRARERSALTVEFDFDTLEVRPSARQPKLSPVRSSAVTAHVDSDEERVIRGNNAESSESSEEDELDPDGDGEFPRVFLRSTITRLLRRESVNVIMDEDDAEYDELDDLLPSYEELPILDAGKMSFVEEIDLAMPSSAA
ncbi:hypothetical protein ATCC90586_000648 [Pythium insidiosum]|nr:hypothetical protein ATCC90586_000648 [Pythium insidiosum]